MILPNGVISRSPMGLISWFEEICSPLSSSEPTCCWPNGMVEAAAMPAPPRTARVQLAATIARGLWPRTKAENFPWLEALDSCSVVDVMDDLEGFFTQANLRTR